MLKRLYIQLNRLKDVVCGAVELEHIKHRGVSITETALTDIHDVKKMVKLSV